MEIELFWLQIYGIDDCKFISTSVNIDLSKFGKLIAVWGCSFKIIKSNLMLYSFYVKFSNF